MIGRRATTRSETAAAVEEKKEDRRFRAAKKREEGLDTLKKRIECRLERLECTNSSDVLEKYDNNHQEGLSGGKEEEEDFSPPSEEDDDDEDDGDDDEGNSFSDANDDDFHHNHDKKKGTRKKKRKTSKKKPLNSKKLKTTANEFLGIASSSSSLGKKSDIASSSRLRRLNFVDMIINEFGNAPDREAKLSQINYITIRAKPSKQPSLHLCPISGYLGKYKDSATGIWYANAAAQRALHEQPPSWVRGSAITPYHDAIRLILSDESL